MKLDLNLKFKSLDGKEEGEFMGSAIANQLALKTVNLEAGRAVSIATRLYAQNFCIEIDEDDATNLLAETSNKQSPFYAALTNVAIDRLQKIIIDAREEAKKKPETKTVSEEKPKKK